jgi:hypothetical protein
VVKIISFAQAEEYKYKDAEGKDFFAAMPKEL